VTRRAKARRFLVYRAWKAADDPLVSAKDIARVTGLSYSTVAHVLVAMDLPHAGIADANRNRRVGASGAFIDRQAVDRFMAGVIDKRETRFAYFGD
jgi:hypothetical protein